MSVDCVDSAGDSFDVFDDQDTSLQVSSWNGREVTCVGPEVLAEKAQIVLQILHQEQKVSVLRHTIIQLDLDEPEPNEFEFALCFGYGKPCLEDVDPIDYQTVICKSFFKKVLHGAKKVAKKVYEVQKKATQAVVDIVVKPVKKAVEKTVDFAKDHKRELLIAAAVIAAVAGAYYVSGACVSGAAAVPPTPKRKEDDEEDKTSVSSSDDPPLPDWIGEIVKTTSLEGSVYDASEESLANAKKEAHQALDLFHQFKTASDSATSTKAVSSVLDELQRTNPGAYNNLVAAPNWDVAIQQGHAKIDQAFTTITTQRKINEAPPPPSPNLLSNFIDKAKMGLELIGRSLCEPELFNPNTPIEHAKLNIALIDNPKQTIREFLVGIVNTFENDPILLSAQPFISPININPLKLAAELTIPLLDDLKSRPYKTAGVIPKGMRITYVNGMANTFEEAFGNANHISSLHPAHPRIDGIYNHSNNPGVDVLEIFTLNYNGYSPKTQEMLIQDWTDFHLENLDNINAKILHFCHSQGAIHTRNALMRLPKEIRDRIIVVAIAPAAIISEELCYRSFNYASNKDIVHWGDPITRYFYACGQGENERIDFLVNWSKLREQLVILEPYEHEGDGLLDHPLQSPTFFKVIKGHLEDYYNTYVSPSEEKKE